MSDVEPATVTDGRDNLPFMVHSELDDLDLDPYEFRAYTHMVRRAGKHSGKGEHWESVEESAKHCRMDPKTYRRALAGLVERRLITREDRAGQTSVYRLTPPKVWRPLPHPAGPTTSGTTTENGSPTESGRGTPTTSGRTPLPKTVDKGNPLKGIPGRESKEPRTQARAASSKPRGKANRPKPPEFDAASIPLPDFISPDLWQDFVKLRQDRNRPLSERAVHEILADLAQAPLDADERLRVSIRRSWTDVFPLDKPRDGPTRTSSAGTAAWDELLAGARNGTLPDLDAAGKAALKAIGGWPAVAYGDERGLGLLRKRYLDAYQTHEATTSEVA